MNKISIITVTYNSSHLIENFLASLNFQEGSGCEVIVVDSGSEDADFTGAVVAESGHRFVRSSVNIGYGAGSNLGAELAQGSWLLFINPDVQMDSVSAERLVSLAEKHSISCIGPTVLNEIGVVRSSYGRTIMPPWRRRTKGFTQSGNFIYAETISGCCMAISAHDFQSIGGFDQRFFMFCEEMDLHRRLVDSGLLVASSLEVTVRTPGGASSRGVTQQWRLVERMVGHTNYIFKHFTPFEGWLAIGYNLAKLTVLANRSNRRESFDQFLRGVRGVLENR